MAMTDNDILTLYKYLAMTQDSANDLKELTENPRERIYAETERLIAQTANDIGSIRPEQPTVRGRVEQGVASAQGMFGLGDERSNLRRAQNLTMLGDFLPGTGTGLAVADFEDARQ